ncbi:MAG: sensor histidine kinase [Ignavibacteriota bacterium]
MSVACQRAAFLSSQLLTFAKGGAPVRRLVSVAKLVMDAVELARAGAQTTFMSELRTICCLQRLTPTKSPRCSTISSSTPGSPCPEGGIIEVAAQNGMSGTDARVRISIRDYGCGIPVDILPRIFDPYFTTKRGASGLGLATAYAIVAKHAGNLSVASHQGRGTTFHR